MSDVKVTDRVEWDWGRGTGEGRVREVIPETVERRLKGSLIRRKGTPHNPALYIETDRGDGVLKLASEVRRM